MLPEVRVLVERAQARRVALEGLVEAVPEEYWARHVPGEAWSARNHLEHLATIEDLVSETVAAVASGWGQAWVGGASTAGELAGRRSTVMESVAGMSIRALRRRMDLSRETMEQLLRGLEPGHLEALVVVAGASDGGSSLRLTLREYLRWWPDHDVEHDAAIRRAVASSPELSTIALLQRLR